MKFIIENIGSIEKAEVVLNNLTVICGENDSGKTTIAKALYAVGQASSSFAVDYQIKQYHDIRTFFIRVRRLAEDIQKPFHKDTDIQKYLTDIEFTVRHLHRHSEIHDNDLYIISELIEHLDKIDVQKLETEYESYEERLSHFNFLINEIKESFEKLKEIHNKIEKEPIKGFLFKALQSEFSDDLILKKESIKPAKLALYENDNCLFSLDFNKDKATKFDSKLDTLPISDSTLIDGSYVFQIASIISDMSMWNSLSRRRTGIENKLPYHIIDLCSKIDGSRRLNDDSDEYCQWDSSKLYNGLMQFNREKRDFEFTVNTENYGANNVSSGIKSLAILDLLCKGRFITGDSILIIDEPETNLHPKWQKEYARSVVTLAKQGTKILINTHSPYMLEALKIYSDHEKIDGCKFYLTQKINDNNELQDTYGDITSIIDLLSEPLSSLMEEMEGNIDDF